MAVLAVGRSGGNCLQPKDLSGAGMTMRMEVGSRRRARASVDQAGRGQVHGRGNDRNSCDECFVAWIVTGTGCFVEWN